MCSTTHFQSVHCLPFVSKVLYHIEGSSQLLRSNEKIHQLADSNEDKGLHVKEQISRDIRKIKVSALYSHRYLVVVLGTYYRCVK